ncbi:hypothetical protein M407DRAFT_26318 [Tulasnella calospora MUT 4182]|uniref:DUF6535 domain-containing protein n=1 Tax=Tulasnella calospora MUT 4182 TaxID=1051891 RepID=A0A0C3KS65_9AGAM|nr:hypothetical protein M407DRAFT_26318 [Tulasnella calospora MUT 4182]
MNTRFEEKLTVIPEIPKEFGEDGGHFYRYYHALADEIDEDMVKSLKAQLDGILIFAGLFAGTPPTTLTPARHRRKRHHILCTGPALGVIYGPFRHFPVNILFSLSLTLALLASFLAVLGQQWLVCGRKRSSGGADAQRWEQLRRYLGAKRWRREAILDDILSSLLQLGLVIFCISFVLYLGTLSGPMCYTVAVPIGFALTCVLVMAFLWKAVLLFLYWASTWFSKGKLFIGNAIHRIGMITRKACMTLKVPSRVRQLVQAARKLIINQPWEGDQKAPPSPAFTMVSWLAKNISRTAEPVNQLTLIAAKRVICTSEDINALLYAAINLQAIRSTEEVRWLLDDDELYSHLSDAWQALTIGETRRSSPSFMQMSAFSSSLLHLVLSSPSYVWATSRSATLRSRLNGSPTPRSQVFVYTLQSLHRVIAVREADLCRCINWDEGALDKGFELFYKNWGYFSKPS